jgi:hypothetical protein
MVGLLLLNVLLLCLIYQRDRTAEAETQRQRTRFAEYNQRILNNQDLMLKNLNVAEDIIAHCHATRQ